MAIGTFGTYERLRVHVYASNRDVIKAARGKLRKDCWHDLSYRDGRKLFYRNMLEYHAKARELAQTWRF